MDEGNNTKPKPDNNSRTITLAVILLIFFVLILILFLYLVRHPALFGSFAQSETGDVVATPNTATYDITPQGISFDNSYLFASPLRAAVSVERVRITAYILDGQGIGVANKKVSLDTDSNVFVTPISPTTDSSGRATFDISSDTPGATNIKASVDGKKLDQEVVVTFN